MHRPLSCSQGRAGRADLVAGYIRQSDFPWLGSAGAPHTAPLQAGAEEVWKEYEVLRRDAAAAGVV